MSIDASVCFVHLFPSFSGESINQSFASAIYQTEMLLSASEM